MLKKAIKISTILSLTILSFSCKKDEITDPMAGFDKLVIATNITSSSPVIGYVGTLKDLTVGSFTNTKSRQFTEGPFITVNKNDVFVTPQRFGDIVKKFTRQADGTLAEAGSFKRHCMNRC